LRTMATTVKTWPEYFDDLKPILNTNITIARPGKDESIIGTIQFFVGTFVGGAWKLFGWAKKSKYSFTKGFLIASLITGFIGSIFNADKRKATFEEIKKNADEANKEVLELIENLKTINNQVVLKFEQTNKILEEAKFVKSGTLTSQFKTLEALADASIIIADWAASYKVLLKKITKGRKSPSDLAYDTAEDVVYKEEAVLGVVFDNEDERIEWTQKVFYLTYLLDWNNDGPGYLQLKECVDSSMSSEEKELGIETIMNEIRDEVEISPEQINFVLIRSLLILNLNPAEIIEIVTKIGVLSKQEVMEKIVLYEDINIAA
ncbi:MAG: hypothetical protein HRT87_11235, partial [Legionellales bacterium]|nr:hypothetical protein [Legionellales bacterium]